MSASAGVVRRDRLPSWRHATRLALCGVQVAADHLSALLRK